MGIGGGDGSVVRYHEGVAFRDVAGPIRSWVSSHRCHPFHKPERGSVGMFEHHHVAAVDLPGIESNQIVAWFENREHGSLGNFKSADQLHGFGLWV